MSKIDEDEARLAPASRRIAGAAYDDGAAAMLTSPTSEGGFR